MDSVSRSARPSHGRIRKTHKTPTRCLFRSRSSWYWMKGSSQMNKLSKDKRDKLILTALLFIGMAGVLYTFVIGAQKDRLATLGKQILIMRDKLSKAERLVKSAPMIEADMKESQKRLDVRQEQMAPQGQYYYWFLKLMDQFREQEKLNPNFIIDITQPEF